MGRLANKRKRHSLLWLLRAAGFMLFGSGLTWLANASTQTQAELSATQVEGQVVSQLAPVIPMAKGEQCVADTDLMRTDHMDLLNHQRDETVIKGIRGNPFSLVGCVNCHAQTSADGTPIRIDAEGQFCESCHAYAAVSIDCFSCHAAVPEQSEVIGLHVPSNRPYSHRPRLTVALSDADDHSEVKLAADHLWKRR